MKNKETFNFENDEMAFYTDEAVAVLRFKTNMFENLSDWNKSRQILSIIDWVEKDPIIKVILIINNKEAFNEEAYKHYIDKLFVYSKEQGKQIIDPDKRLLNARQMNTFRSFIMKMVGCKKIYIAGLQGDIVTPFFGASLSADFRYAAKDMVFNFANIKYGLHHAGALPFFLSRYVGQSKSIELLFRCDHLYAGEALNLGLINEIFDNGDFEQSCLEKAKSLCNINPMMVRLTKRLANNFTEELERYFNLESKLIGF
jgi:enoyl-CoA hydratase/carnithine racemase